MAPSARILILLFRRDLRLNDNPLFTLISQTQHTHLLPLHVLSPLAVEVSGLLSDPEAPCPYPQTRSTLGNFWKCGPHRVRFLAESLWDLKESLRNLGSDLVLRVGRPEEVLAGVLDGLRRNGVEVVGVAMADAVGEEERIEAGRIRKVVECRGVNWRGMENGSYLYSLKDLAFEPKDTPAVFTNFRKTVEPLRHTIPAALPAPTSMHPLPPNIPPQAEPFRIPPTLDGLVSALQAPLKDLGLQGKPLEFPEGARSAHPFVGGEMQAQQRMRHLISSGAASNYKDTRNGLLGSDFSTKLSAYLSHGCISARSIHDSLASFEDGSDSAAAAAAGHGKGENRGTACIRFELLWRDFFRLAALQVGARLFAIHPFPIPRGYDAAAWQTLAAAATPASLGRFLRGTTGCALVDASQRELYHTGYTSNRTRQNVASYLAKRLRIDWRVGAEWYECLLIDYDAASNWGNWRYSSGVGNDPRQDRVFNQVKQAKDYDAGEYVRMWCPELRTVRGGGDGLWMPALLKGQEREAVCAHGDEAREMVEKPLVAIHGASGGKRRNGGGGGEGGHGKCKGRKEKGHNGRKEVKAANEGI